LRHSGSGIKSSRGTAHDDNLVAVRLAPLYSLIRWQQLRFTFRINYEILRSPGLAVPRPTAFPALLTLKEWVSEQPP
jgi:hypothetical protein